MTRWVQRVFATREDLLDLLEEVATTEPLKFVEFGLRDSPPLVFHTPGELPGLGQPVGPTHPGNPRYMVLLESQELRLREVAQDRGPAKTKVDLRDHPGALVLAPGGVADGVLLYSELMAGLSSSADMPLRQAFAAALSCLESASGFRVGPAARALWEQGTRLVQSTRQPESSDVELPPSPKTPRSPSTRPKP